MKGCCWRGFSAVVVGVRAHDRMKTLLVLLVLVVLVVVFQGRAAGGDESGGCIGDDGEGSRTRGRWGGNSLAPGNAEEPTHFKFPVCGVGKEKKRGVKKSSIRYSFIGQMM